MRSLTLCLLLLVPLTSQAAEQRIEERRTVASDAQVEIGNVRGSVVVQGWDRAEIEISGTLGEGVKGLLIEGDERRLSVRVDYPRNGGGRGWFGWWGSEQVGDSDLLIKLPRGASLDVDTVSASIDADAVDGARAAIKSVSGAVRFAGSPRSLEVNTVSGEQRLSGRFEAVRMETVSGQVSLTNVHAGSVHAESVSGDFELHLDGVEALSAATVSGDVRLKLARAHGRIRAETLSGVVDITLPSNASARLQASSFSGSIESDVGQVERKRYGPGASLAHVLGNGDADVNVESFSGRIRIRLE